MKDYKKILEGVVDIINTTEKSDIGFTNICAYIGEECPELKERDDELIKKAIVTVLKEIDEHIGRGYILVGNKRVDNSEIIAWLERQCEKKKLEEFEIQGEKRSTDKIEPKFKIGDFIVNDYCMGRVVEITNDAYLLDTEQGIPFSSHSTRLWDITKDAKDGDVLYSPCCKLLWIYKDGNSCYIGNNLNYNENCVVVNSPICIPTDAIPATKEQKEILFMVMKDAGYTFDFEKKELKKIERKPADKVEPKFHEGEWITNGDDTWKIVEVKPLDYILQSQDGKIVDDTISFVDEQFHSFTIEDAKDGDVLCYETENEFRIFIYKNGHLLNLIQYMSN